jgi:hypothetical protein
MSFFRKLLIILLILTSGKVSCQNLFTYNGVYNYFIGTDEPDPNWRKPDFDDSNWKSGFKNIGFGNRNDSTKIQQTTSVYLRIKFDVTDKASIKSLNFLVDFDDAFVAYLNGNEIARVNTGKPGEYIAHNRLADRSHEAVLYRPTSYYVLGYYIDSAKISRCLSEGHNVLAVQVHNDSINGSDLFFVSQLLNLTNSVFSFYNQAVQCKKQVPMDSSYFPIIMINTDEYGTALSHVKYNARMGIINNGKYNLNRITDPFTDFNGKISVEIRGEITSMLSKKCFGIETRDESDNDTSVSLLGMPRENDWILYGPVLDKSLIRNELGMILGRKSGHYEPRTRYCELVMNGEFLGLYIMIEKIKRDKNRVDVSKLSPSDNSGLSLTGGYVVKYDKWSERVLQYIYPKKEDITPAQEKYITDFFKNFYSVLNRPEFADKLTGYRKYIDEQSLIDYVIANEVLKNCDSYKYSTYFYKDRDDIDGRIKFGPLWDNDLAFGNGIWQNGYLIEGWQFAEPTNTSLEITKLFADTSLVNQFKERWGTLRNGFLSTDSMIYFIDSLANYIEAPRQRNYEVWPLFDKDIWNTWSAPGFNLFPTYEAEIMNLKSWLEQRLSWIDENIAGIYYPVPAGIQTYFASSEDKFNTYPNPFSTALKIDMNVDSPGSYVVKMADMVGRTVLMKQVSLSAGFTRMSMDAGELSGLSKGIYVLTITENGVMVHMERLVRY